MHIRRQGAKIRSTYIAFAHREKKRLEEHVGGLEKEIQVKEKEVERLKGMSFFFHKRIYSTHSFSDIAERTESLTAAALEHKKQSRKSLCRYYNSSRDHHYY